MVEGERPKEIRLQVAGARSADVGRGVARLNERALETLGLREGDVIEVAGKRTTAAIALQPYPEDSGLDLIRLDRLERANAGVGIGDHVEVRKADVKPARRVVVAPAQQNLRLTGSGEALRRTLYQRPLTAGDVISTSVHRPAMGGAPSGAFPDEFFRSFFQQPAYPRIGFLTDVDAHAA